jgi:hypothetical protein
MRRGFGIPALTRRFAAPSPRGRGISRKTNFRFVKSTEIHAARESATITAIAIWTLPGWLRLVRRWCQVSLSGADGVVRLSHRLSVVERTTPSAPSKEASRHLSGCRVHPSFTKEGSFGHPNRPAMPCGRVDVIVSFPQPANLNGLKVGRTAVGCARVNVTSSSS